MNIDFAAIRAGLAELPRADNHKPDEPVDPAMVYLVSGHRAALDPDRALVVANRGMGKSFWAHALLQPDVREQVATTFRQPSLRSIRVEIGFNASERAAGIAPSPETVRGNASSPDAVWRAVLARAAGVITGAALPPSFSHLVRWVEEDAERYGRLMTEADTELHGRSEKLLVVFDALDRLANDWPTTRRLAKALLGQALAAQSYRAIRLKLFMRIDQFHDGALFNFPDASKIRNTRVALDWDTSDLYGLLFARLRADEEAGHAFDSMQMQLRVEATRGLLPSVEPDRMLKRTSDIMAGEFMGAGAKRGKVFTWLPTHLADAHGQTSPRTFLTAWREAAKHGSPSADRAVDHLGIMEGVRKASEDRLRELAEDYPWVGVLLEPMRGEKVPMERRQLEQLWREKDTASRVFDASQQSNRLPPALVDEPGISKEDALIRSLQAIGVLEIRGNGKINVPDIFRVEAGIKRKGGVKPPRRGRS